MATIFKKVNNDRIMIARILLILIVNFTNLSRRGENSACLHIIQIYMYSLHREFKIQRTGYDYGSIIYKPLHTFILGLVQTSNFSCAESNANQQNPLFELVCIRFGNMKSSTLELGLTIIQTPSHNSQIMFFCGFVTTQTSCKSCCF